jgi:hypothetical protein
MRIKDEKLTGAREGIAHKRLPRIASERSDIDHLVGAGRSLADLLKADAVRGGPFMHEAIWTLRNAHYRVLRNRDQRDQRKAERSKKA